MYLVEEICSQMCDDLANCLGKDCKDAFLVWVAILFAYAYLDKLRCFCIFSLISCWIKLYKFILVVVEQIHVEVFWQMHCLYVEFFVILYPQLDLLLVQGIVLAWWKLNVFSYRDTGGESSAPALCWADSWWVPPAWAVTYGYGAVWYCCIEWLNQAYSYLLFCCTSVGCFFGYNAFRKNLGWHLWSGRTHLFFPFTLVVAFLLWLAVANISLLRTWLKNTPTCQPMRKSESIKSIKPLYFGCSYTQEVGLDKHSAQF